MSRYDCFAAGFGAGVIVIVVFLFSIATPVNQDALDKCAKAHDVYQCEMVAVPKTGEK